MNPKENSEEEKSVPIEESGVFATVEWAVWHLTPNGWVRGSYKNEFEGSQDITAPKDRVLSCLYKECLADEWSTEVDETFRLESKDQAISTLLEKYGPSPTEL
ncbi:MAG: hypothetical protein ACI9S8_001930 [Chlamydiales bacterium]|jgi:hypothetical protein